MTDEKIDVPGRNQSDLLYYAGIHDTKGILIPCTVYFKRGEVLQPAYDLERGDFVCIIRKRNIIPDKKKSK